MSTTLPELPDAGLIYMGLTGNPEHAYSADQMHAYGLAVWKAAMEQAAKEAEARSASVQKSNTYRGRVNAAAMFAADQLEFLASVLRSLPLPEQGGPQ